MRPPLLMLVLIILSGSSPSSTLGERMSGATPQQPATAPANSEAASISISLAPAQPDVSHRYPVLVQLTNTGRSDVVVFRPLDGSDYGWHLPHYRFNVHTADGLELPLYGRCGVSGLWAGTSWPDSYAVKLAPGESLEVKMQPPQIQQPGTYRVGFAYEYRIDPKVQERFATPAGAWVGTAEAKEIELFFPEQPSR